MNITTNEWRELIETCIRIRAFEEAIEAVYEKDLIQSPVHLSIGQELTSVLIAKFLEKKDYVIGNYRSHALAISVTTSIEKLMLELCAKKDGMYGGRAGSMHLGDPKANMPWTSAIVGSGVPVATGLAWVSKQLNDNSIVIAQFGDGALEEGCVLESMNVAATYSLPLIFILEDNNLAIYTKQEKRKNINSSNTARAESFGIKTFKTSIKEPVNMANIFDHAFAYTRESMKPTFISVDCYRWRQHVGIGGDYDIGYRKIEELNKWRNYDIIEYPQLVGIDDIDTTALLEQNKQDYISKFEYYSTFEDPTE